MLTTETPAPYNRSDMSVDDPALDAAIRRHEERLARDPASLAFAARRPLPKGREDTRSRGALPERSRPVPSLHDGAPHPRQDPRGRGRPRRGARRDRGDPRAEPTRSPVPPPRGGDPAPPGAHRPGGDPLGSGRQARPRRPRVALAARAAPRDDAGGGRGERAPARGRRRHARAG